MLTTWLGLFFGYVLVWYKDHDSRLRQWAPMSLVWLVTGIIIHYAGWKMNKQLWSPSYLFLMAGCTGGCFMLFYLLLDHRTWQPTWLKRGWALGARAQVNLTDAFLPFIWIGMNTIFIFIMSPSGDVFGSALVRNPKLFVFFFCVCVCVCVSVCMSVCV